MMGGGGGATAPYSYALARGGVTMTRENLACETRGLKTRLYRTTSGLRNYAVVARQLPRTAICGTSP